VEVNSPGGAVTGGGMGVWAGPAAAWAGGGREVGGGRREEVCWAPVMKLTHVLNPVAAKPGSNLARCQAVCFESIRRAMAYTRAVCPKVEVEVVCAVYAEDEPAVPEFCAAKGGLERSLVDVCQVRPARKLPLVGDIYRVALERGTGDAVIYTNVDIGLQPFFYELVAHLLQTQCPALGITRRNIAEEPIDPAQMCLMMSQVGERFQGMDTFVCPRSHIREFDLGEVVIGLPTVEYAVLGNIDAACGFGCKLFKHLHANFHHGNEQVWRVDQRFCDFNDAQTTGVLTRLKARHPGFPPHCLFDWFQAKFLKQRPRAKGLKGRVMDLLGLRKRHPEPFDIVSGE
jgi:hypothetical protein